MSREPGVNNSSIDEPQCEESRGQLRPGEVVLGSFVGLAHDGRALANFIIDGIDFRGRLATTTVPLVQADAGRQITLMFLDQDIEKPVITGVVHNALDAILALSEEEGQVEDEDEALFSLPPTDEARATISVDNEPLDKLLIEGKDEVTLRCGDASITLTRNGKLILRGKYILSRSSGVNRVLGASVQVN